MNIANDIAYQIGQIIGYLEESIEQRKNKMIASLIPIMSNLASVLGLVILSILVLFSFILSISVGTAFLITHLTSSLILGVSLAVIVMLALVFLLIVYMKKVIKYWVSDIFYDDQEMERLKLTGSITEQTK